MEKVKKFTDAMVRNIKPSEKRTEHSEGNGFILRVSPSGIKSWVYYFKFSGKPYRFTLGRYPALSVADARKEVGIAGALKDNGINPIQHKKDMEEAKAKELLDEKETIEYLANEFYTDYIVKIRKSPLNVKQIINAEIIPNLGKIKLNEITTRQIVLSVKEIAHRGANSHANKTLAIIKQMFNYAISVGMTEINPAQNIKAKVIGGKENTRERFLSMDEIKSIWLWFSDSNNHKIHPATVLAFKILLLTGVRSGELRLANISEIDLEHSLWTIPAEHTKTGITHRVHLAPLTITLFKELIELTNCQFILPSSVESKEDGNEKYKPLTDRALPRAVKRTEGKINNVEPWTPHDLRRTFSTQVSAMGIKTAIVEKCLAHQLPKIMATYNKHEYLDERKEALEQWSQKIDNLVNNSNVVVLDNARGTR